jgi:hypothetical protein
VEVDSALGSLHCVDVSIAADVSEMLAASIFKVKMSRMG